MDGADEKSMKPKEDETLDETAYLLKSPRNAQRLLESIATLEAGGGTERTLLK